MKHKNIIIAFVVVLVIVITTVSGTYVESQKCPTGWERDNLTGKCAMTEIPTLSVELGENWTGEFYTGIAYSITNSTMTFSLPSNQTTTIPVAADLSMSKYPYLNGMGDYDRLHPNGIWYVKARVTVLVNVTGARFIDVYVNGNMATRVASNSQVMGNVIVQDAKFWKAEYLSATCNDPYHVAVGPWCARDSYPTLNFVTFYNPTNADAMIRMDVLVIWVPYLGLMK